MPRRAKFRSSPRRLRQRRGVILITALGIIVILAGMVIAYAISMRSEALASGNRLSYAQANAVEQGAEMWTLAQIDTNAPDAVTITTTPAEAIQVGTGYFWILHPISDVTQDQTYGYGITDEAGKINLNTATATTDLTGPQLANLPNLEEQPNVADNIVAWVGSNDPLGAQASDYQSLSYDTRADLGLVGGIESTDELLLVEDLTPQMLYGQDYNRNGVIEASEQNANGANTIQSGGEDPRGFYNYVTCYSTVPAANPSLSVTVPINNFNNNSMTMLSQAMQLANVGDSAQILSTLGSNIGPRSPPIRNMGAFYNAASPAMTPNDFGLIFPYLVAPQSKTVVPLNVNTASEQAFACLPGLSAGDAQTLASAQSDGMFSGNLAWFFNALQPNQIVGLASYVTDRSYKYSADIVAVSGDGRSFKRVRIVVDATTTPSQIVYRKDLTALGWPLDPSIRAALRLGKPPPDLGSTTNNSSGIMGPTNQ